MLVMPTNFIDCVFWKFVLFSEWSYQLVVKRNSQGRVSAIWECKRKRLVEGKVKGLAV